MPITMSSMHSAKPNSRGKFVNFSRSDINPQAVAPVYMNDNLQPIIMECTKDAENSGKFQMCQFIDKHNQKIIVHKVAFINNQVSQTRLTSYPHPRGEIINRLEYPEQNAQCEVFGLTETGLTVNCKDLLKEKQYFGQFQ